MPTRMAHNPKMAALQAFRLYEDKGDEHGNYCIILDICVYIYIWTMEKKMQTTI